MTDTPDFRMNANMHSAFKREVIRLRGGVRQVDLTDDAKRAGVVARYEFFSRTLHHHHEGEDTYLWPAVREKAQPEEVVILDSMEAEHESLAAALAALDNDFANLGPDSDTALIARHFDELLVVLNGHCAHEERDGVPVVQKYLGEEDLKEFVKFTRSGPDSSLVLPWVCDGATPGEEQSTWGMIPVFVRVFLRPVLNRKYRRFTAACGV